MGRTTETLTKFAPDAGLLIARLAVGSVGIFHGGQKLFGLFGGYGIKGTAGFLESLGIPLPTLSTIAAGSAEFFGGVALVVGLATRFASLNMAFTMLVAIATVHWGKFDAQQGGMEYPFTLGAVLLAFVLTGAGRFSLDAVAWPRLRAAFARRDASPRAALSAA